VKKSFIIKNLFLFIAFFQINFLSSSELSLKFEKILLLSIEQVEEKIEVEKLVKNVDIVCEKFEELEAVPAENKKFEKLCKTIEVIDSDVNDKKDVRLKHILWLERCVKDLEKDPLAEAHLAEAHHVSEFSSILKNDVLPDLSKNVGTKWGRVKDKFVQKILKPYWWVSIPIAIAATVGVVWYLKYKKRKSESESNEESESEEYIKINFHAGEKFPDGYILDHDTGKRVNHPVEAIFLREIGPNGEIKVKRIDKIDNKNLNENQYIISNNPTLVQEFCGPCALHTRFNFKEEGDNLNREKFEKLANKCAKAIAFRKIIPNNFSRCSWKWAKKNKNIFETKNIYEIVEKWKEDEGYKKEIKIDLKKINNALNRGTSNSASEGLNYIFDDDLDKNFLMYDNFSYNSVGCQDHFERHHCYGKRIDKFRNEGKPLYLHISTGDGKFGKKKKKVNLNFKKKGSYFNHAFLAKFSWSEEPKKSPIKIDLWDSYRGADNRFSPIVHDAYERVVKNKFTKPDKDEA